MVERKSKVEGKLERKSLVELYSDVGSQAYAPLTRIGVFRDRNSEQNVVKSKYLTSLNGISFICLCLCIWSLVRTVMAEL